MNRIVWRWQERDFGFRFRSGKGKRVTEYYQAHRPGEFYVVPVGQRKLKKADADNLATLWPEPTSSQVVANPWRNYDRDWDWIDTADGLCLNYAGCLDQEEVNRREDEGVQRAMEHVAELVQRAQPAPLTMSLIQQLHTDLMGAIYPFAGQWRVVDLHKGDGPTRWPLPPCGIQPLMDVLERDVFARSPFLSEDDEKLFGFVAEVMCELLALHPFREGNGRLAFIVGNLILMQNNLLPLTTYERHNDQTRYYHACEAGRVNKDYQPLAALLAEWEDQALAHWEETHGQ